MLERVSASSQFVAAAIARDPGLWETLLAEGYVAQPRVAGSLVEALKTAAAGIDDEGAIMTLLRWWRRRELVRIACRDLANASTVEESLRDLTELADATISCAVQFAYDALAQRYGQPRPEGGGDPMPLVTLGMGKLGGGELNFSSDIDLIFLFPEAGDTDGARATSNEEFFTRLARSVIKILGAVTEEGFVFRVDMRLRPFGDSGPLAVSFGFFENYLQQHGRDWERYAYIKARAITGTEAFEPVYRDVLRPFVYRRYLDFGVFEALREMKAMIAREVERRDLQGNVKLGPGGIREIEFIIQAFQLLRGGSDRRLQSQSLLEVLPLLAGDKLLGAQVVREMRAAYLYLRRLENRLQMLDDKQTHELPEDEAIRHRLLAAMGFSADESGWQQLCAALNEQRNIVTRCFRSVLFGPVAEQAPMMNLEALWDPKREMPALQQTIAAQGLTNVEPLAEMLAQWRDSQFIQRLDDAGRKRLQGLMPRVFKELKNTLKPVPEAEDNGAVLTLRRILNVLESLGRRSAYLALLNENPPALQRLVSICARSEFLTQQIAAFPLLLDELIDRRVLEELPSREDFQQELALKHANSPDSDPEQQVELLRQFQRAAMFRVALADLAGRLPLMQVSDRLTDIAELIVGEVTRLAWEQITGMYGSPMCAPDAATPLRPVSIGVVGYGKLGSIELGYSSDLDLVFLHDSIGEIQRTDGAKSIDNNMFFLRLGQRIVHLLTMHSAAGRLYEVDVRLRPSGKGGLMVTQLAAFDDYQKNEAWTWEHQALLRARAVAGAPQVREQFEAIRVDVLCNHIRRATLREDVSKMRERMRAELSKSKEGQFDVKQDAGGIADIEFLAQYWALKWADRYSALVMFSDTIRQLESVASGDLVSQQTIDVLTRVYREYRQEIHHRALEGKAAVVPAEQFAEQRQQVTRIWEATMK